MSMEGFFEYILIFFVIILVAAGMCGFIYLIISSDTARMEEKSEACMRLCDAKDESYVNAKSTRTGYECGCVDDVGELRRYPI